MSQSFRVIASQRVQVPANTKQYTTLYTVSPGKRLKLRQVEVFFPVGTYDELRVKILYGWTSVAPTDGFFTGDETTIVKDVDIEYGSMQPVRAYLENLNLANQRECVITLLGEET
jgi:hypothetical protein